MKTSEQSMWNPFKINNKEHWKDIITDADVFIVNFEQISQIVLVFPGIFLSTFLQPVNGSKNSSWIELWNSIFSIWLFWSTFPWTPIKLYTTAVPGKRLQAILLQSEKVSEMYFPANWSPKFRDNELSKESRNWIFGKKRL